MFLQTFISGFYLLVAIVAGGILARYGGVASGVAFGASVFVASVQIHLLFLARHAAKTHSEQVARLRADHVTLAEELAEARAKAEELEIKLRVESRKSSEALAHEMRMIEEMFGQLEQSLETRIEARAQASMVSELANATSADPILENIRDALAHNRVELHLQPIVSLPNRRPAFYEGFTRLRDELGAIILPNVFLQAADDAGLLSTIDNLLLFRCVQIVRRLSQKDRRVGIFCNVALNSLRDEIFFPQFYQFMKENRDLAGSVIFELGQESFDSRTSVEARNMAKLLDLGFRFSIDKVRHLEVDLADLERSGVRFFKVEAGLFLHEVIDGGQRPRSSVARDLAPHDVPAVFQRYGIELIAEKIETEKMVVEILEFEFALAQGHLFGTVRPVKGELLDDAGPAPDFSARKRAAR